MLSVQHKTISSQVQFLCFPLACVHVCGQVVKFITVNACLWPASPAPAYCPAALSTTVALEWFSCLGR